MEGALADLSPEELQQKFKKLEEKPKPPVISPEEQSKIISQYEQQSPEIKEKLNDLVKHSCSYCEQEFKTPPLGWSHGICLRHLEAQYKMMGMDMPPTAGKDVCIDLKKLSPEELKLAINLFGIIWHKKKG